MNTKSILTGGLLAGLVINIGETILNIPIVGDDMDTLITKFGLPPMAGSTIGLFVVMCFLLGIACVWLYAAVRPRLGPGVGTAIKVGVFVWALACLWPSIGMTAMGFFPKNLSMIVLAWELVEIPLATVAGAWLYKESTVAAGR